MSASPNQRYRAFISYSHRDRKWGEWLHKALERYRVPKELIGTQGSHGVVPSSLFPVFRDRDEISVATDLPAVIKEALDKSDCLVVICSPRSATSEWVEKEILEFKRLGRANRIFALIVDGDLYAAPKSGGQAQLECFPDALTLAITEGAQHGVERTEPAAADARPQGDGKEEALLKVIAGVLGVRFNDLKRRELQAARRRQRITQAIAATIAALSVMAAIAAFVAFEQRDSARQAAEQLYWESVTSNLLRADYRGVGTAIVSHRGDTPVFEDLFALVQVARMAPDFDYVSMGAGMYRLGFAFSEDDSRLAILGGEEGDQLEVWDTQTWKRTASQKLEGILIYGAATVRGTGNRNVFYYGGYGGYAFEGQPKGSSNPFFGIDAVIDTAFGSISVTSSEAKVRVPLDEGELSALKLRKKSVKFDEQGLTLAESRLGTALPGMECQLSPAARFVYCTDSYHVKVFRSGAIVPTETSRTALENYAIPEELNVPFKVGGLLIDGDFWLGRRYLSYFTVTHENFPGSAFASPLGITPPVDRGFSADGRWVVSYQWPGAGRIYESRRWASLPSVQLAATVALGERTCVFSEDQRLIQCPGSSAPAYLLSRAEFEANPSVVAKLAQCLAELGQGERLSCVDAIEQLVAVTANATSQPLRETMDTRIDPEDFWPELDPDS